jgi:phage terminase small subunit
MGGNRAEQKEALETLVEFNGRLVKDMNMIIKELTGKRLDDTDKFLKSIVDATNWEIQVMNGTMDLLNEGKERIKKEQFNGKILKLGAAIKDRNDAKTAEAIQALIPEFENLQAAAREVLAAA